VKRALIRKLVLCAAIAASFVPPALGIFGFGDIVFDPTNFGKAVEQLIEMQRQYAQLVQTYQTLRRQYDHLVWMAKRVPVNMASRYRAVAAPWRGSSAGNAYGTTAGWIASINSGAAVEAGYAQATERLAAYGAALARIPAGQIERVKTSYATVELTDGANLHGIETIGRLRASAAHDEAVLRNLEDDSLSADPNMNTEIAVLNKINAAGLFTLRNAQSANQLLVALAEGQIIEAKRTRDAEARTINTHVRFIAEGKAAMAAQARDASAALRAWRMP